jgi:hypothetical protein
VFVRQARVTGFPAVLNSSAVTKRAEEIDNGQKGDSEVFRSEWDRGVPVLTDGASRLKELGG